MEVALGPSHDASNEGKLCRRHGSSRLSRPTRFPYRLGVVILLTGGTGFVGRHLARQFISDRSAVRVLSRQPGRVPLPEGISWVQGDLGDALSLHAALRGVGTVVHAAAVVPGGATPDEALERVNADGTRALADAARAEIGRAHV